MDGPIARRRSRFWIDEKRIESGNESTSESGKGGRKPSPLFQRKHPLRVNIAQVIRSLDFRNHPIILSRS